MADQQRKQTAEEIAADNALLQNKLLQVQLETALITKEQQIAQNEAWRQREAERRRGNARRQAQFKQDRQGRLARQRRCSHRQGGHAQGDPLQGKGDSALTRSQVFFRGNYLIQCNRCELKVQRPHPELRRIDPKLFAAAMSEYDLLCELSESNNLQPMEGTTFSFTNKDGIPVWPKLDPNATKGDEIPKPELLGITTESLAYLKSKGEKVPMRGRARLAASAAVED